MADLIPAAFENLLRRIFLELEREGKIFDLPAGKFYRHTSSSPDLSVQFHGLRASTPVGPAAGPQDQLVQNIVLSWLAGARILELKTVQINDQLQIPRPCIDATNVGFNVEWSQELTLEQSLQEYVSASMMVDILKAAGLPGEDAPASTRDTIFDMSVGYDLAGIQSPQVRSWIAGMKDASALVEGLRARIPADFSRYRDLPFRTRISNTLTLSTFHGCPAEEIEGIVYFLLTEMDLHVTIKMNPPLLGREGVDYLLHDVLGYEDIQTREEDFDRDLKFPQALEIVDRLSEVARSRGRTLGVKFSNTLVVRNHRSFFTDETMYMSGAPLHVITLNLAQKFREAVGAGVPISFSAGVDQFNFPLCVAMGFVPVTTCTDLLRPGGYGRLHKYLINLEQKMSDAGAGDIANFILKSEGHGGAAVARAFGEVRSALQILEGSIPTADLGQVNLFLDDSERRAKDHLGTLAADLGEWCRGMIRDFERQVAPAIERWVASACHQALERIHDRAVREAAYLNTPGIVERATADPRYRLERNRAIPRKIGSRLYLYDCINCDKCVPVCPNDANFVYEVEPVEVQLRTYELTEAGVRITEAGRFTVAKSHQLANFADFCNDCGNCDVFCPEDGGPYLVKPRLFGSRAAWERSTTHDGYYVERRNGHDRAFGRINQREFSLDLDRERDRVVFTDQVLSVELEYSSDEPVSVRVLDAQRTGHALSMEPYYVLRTLMRGVLDPRRVNFVNVTSID
ncbi:MAG: glutamate synthase [Acidobacteria bacterium]|nr:glutamate synthase [Acidobacteriota bacterium]